MNKIITSILLLFSFLGLNAKDFPAKPNPPKLVNDFVGVLNTQEQASLEAKLLTYSDSTSTQIAIVIENSLEGEDAFDYSQRLAEAWQIGVKGKNNGLLIYIAIEDRKIWIQNGYGMEGTITDALSKRIIEEIIKPNFREKDYYDGLNEATDLIMKAASGEYVNDAPKRTGKKSPSPFLVILGIIAVILFSIFNSRGGGGLGGRRRGFGGGPYFGTFGSGGFSGGSGFGGGGGGFGGFGGGSFGGGGAGGSW